MASSKLSLSEKYEDGSVYQMHCGTGEYNSIVKHNGYWFVLAVFPDLKRFEQMRHFTLKDDDILIASFPRSGSICILYCAAKSYHLL